VCTCARGGGKDRYLKQIRMEMLRVRIQMFSVHANLIWRGKRGRESLEVLGSLTAEGKSTGKRKIE